MAIDTSKGDDPLVILDSESIPIPPGAKRGPRPHLDEVSRPRYNAEIWWIIGAVGFASLIAGILIGRLF